MKPLYEITNDYQLFIESMDENGDINMEQLTHLEEITQSFEEKSINVAKLIKNLEAEESAIEEATKEMIKRHEKVIKKICWIRKYLKENMEKCGVQSIRSPWFDIKIRRNPMSINIVDESIVPAEYIEEEMIKHFDKRKMLDAIKTDVIIPGIIAESNTRIEIK